MMASPNSLIKQLALVSCLVFTLSTFASPLPKLERRSPFIVYDPNGGEGLFSEDGSTRIVPEETVPKVDDDTHQKESLEIHPDMNELVEKYAPVFKLS